MPGATARTYGRAKALGAAGAQAVMGGRDFNAGRPMVQESLAIGLELGLQDVVVWARAVLALVGGLRGDIGLMELEEFALETLATAQQSGDSWGENRVLMGLAMLALKQGNVELAIARLEAAIGVARAASDTWSLATTLMGLGDVERSRGGHVRAGALYEESAAVFAGLDLGEHPLEFPHILHNLGYVALAAGDTPTARDHFVHAMSAYRQIGDKPGVAECVVGLAAVAAAHGRSENAARLFGMAEVAFEAVGAQLWYTNRGDYERWVAVARAGLESTAFAAAWAEGRAVRFDQAIERALESER
jgi:tetratricopeptide (TPR) repeat protein